MLSVKLQVSSTCWIDPNFVLNTRFNFWPNLPIVSSFPAVFFIFFFAFKNILFLFVDPFSQDPNFSKFQNFFFYFRLFVVLSFNEFEGKNWFRPNLNHFLLFFSAKQIAGFPTPLGGKVLYEYRTTVGSSTREMNCLLHNSFHLCCASISSHFSTIFISSFSEINVFLFHYNYFNGHLCIFQ